MRRDALELLDLVSVPMEEESGGCRRERSRERRAADSEDFVKIRAVDRGLVSSGGVEAEVDVLADESEDTELAESESESESVSDEPSDEVELPDDTLAERWRLDVGCLEPTPIFRCSRRS